MFLHSLATANPAHVFTQEQCWAIARESGSRMRLHERSMLVLQKVLNGNSGIDTRHFAVADFGRTFDRTADELNGEFRREAPLLATDALRAALDRAGLRPDELDALFICTCTGYLCPGLTSYVAELVGLRRDAYLQDLVGLGCGAAIPTLRSAHGFLAAEPKARVACLAVEVCSAAFYVDDDVGVLISACLFGDGAAATIWGAQPGATGLQVSGFDTQLVPEDRDLLRFETRDGKLRNLLHRSVPGKAASAVSELWARRGPRSISRVAVHPGGRDVILAVAPVLAPHELSATERVLRTRGNMSSPSVLFVVEELLREGVPADGDIWLVSFGAGFAAHSCRLGRTSNQ
jgi:predicted naringenin-chalcone synthase